MRPRPSELIANEWNHFSEGWGECREDFEASVRQEPWLAVLLAGAFGFLFQLAPMGKIVGGVLRAVFWLARPALLVLGMVALAGRLKQKKTGAE